MGRFSKDATVANLSNTLPFSRKTEKNHGNPESGCGCRGRNSKQMPLECASRALQPKSPATYLLLLQVHNPLSVIPKSEKL
jgi:hypothetical protein